LWRSIVGRVQKRNEVRKETKTVSTIAFNKVKNLKKTKKE